MRIAVAADERVGVADAVVEELRRRGHEPVLHGALAEHDQGGSREEGRVSDLREARAGRLSIRPEPPPPRMPRRIAARALAQAAGRLDRETARRSIA